MKRAYIVVIALMCALLLSGQAFAVTEQFKTTSWRISKDGDLIPVNDSTNNIGAVGTEVSIIYVDNLVVNTNIKGSGVYPVTFLYATPATLAATDSGKTYIIDYGYHATAQTTVSVTLPAAADGLYFTFISGDGSTIRLRPNDANQTGIYADGFRFAETEGTITPTPMMKTGATLRMKNDQQQATGACVTIVGMTTVPSTPNDPTQQNKGNGGAWYIASMKGIWDSDGTVYPVYRP